MLFTFFSINNFTKYFIFFFLFIFLLIIISNGPFSLFGHSNDIENEIDTSTEIILARLSRAMAELTALKSQNEELRSLIQNFIPQLQLNDIDGGHSSHSSSSSSNIGSRLQQQQRLFVNSIPLDSQYEFSRRKLMTDLNELWNYIRTVETAKPESKNFIKELKNSLLFDLGM